MGAVWLARDELLGRDVAVKQVLIPVGSDPEATDGHREAAMREGRIAARLTHPHAVSVYDMVDDGGTPWLVMEYLPSRSLAQVLTQRGTLPVQQVAQIGAQVADALIAVHAAGVIHRDVKPGNILIGEGDRSDGLVKITDFGISRARGDVSLTQTGVVKGTPAYLAPEVARGQEPDEASDVFSLGATLYACLEGTPPFGMTENPLEMLYRVAGGDFQQPRNAGALTRPLVRMLDSDPAKRPSMTEVRDQLALLAAGPDRDVTEVLTARTPLPQTLTDVRPVGGRVLPAVPPTAVEQAAAVPAAAERPARTAVGPAATPGASRPPATTGHRGAGGATAGTPGPARGRGRRPAARRRPAGRVRARLAGRPGRRADARRGPDQLGPGLAVAVPAAVPDGDHGVAPVERRELTGDVGELTGDHRGDLTEGTRRSRTGLRGRGGAGDHELLRAAPPGPADRLRPHRSDPAGRGEPRQLHRLLEPVQLRHAGPGLGDRRLADGHRTGHLRGGRRLAPRAAHLHAGPR
jgi:hypothetical protein